MTTLVRIAYVLATLISLRGPSRVTLLRPGDLELRVEHAERERDEARARVHTLEERDHSSRSGSDNAMFVELGATLLSVAYGSGGANLAVIGNFVLGLGFIVVGAGRWAIEEAGRRSR